MIFFFWSRTQTTVIKNESELHIFPSGCYLDHVIRHSEILQYRLLNNQLCNFYKIELEKLCFFQLLTPF